MADPRFFAVRGPLTLGELAEIAGATLFPGADASRRFADVAPLASAGPDEVSFLDNPRYVGAFVDSRAGACVVHPVHADKAPDGMALLLTDKPYRGYARIAQAFYPAATPVPGIVAGAVVDPSARLGDGTRVEAGAVVGPGAEIGARCLIGANAVVGAGVVIGDDTRIGPNVSLAYCLIGSRVRIYAGARIGEDGFGFAADSGLPVSVPQLGRVIVEDDVEIGANTTVDRGAGPDTVIGRGSRIDNLVQIGHNVTVGRGCIIVAQAGISGSTTLDDNVIIAAQGGVAGHLRIGKGARVAAKAGVMRDVAEGDSVGGFPAMPVKRWLRNFAVLNRLAEKKSG